MIFVFFCLDSLNRIDAMFVSTCPTETELFEKLLGAEVETTHRAAKGDLVCKFLIKERKEGYL